MGGIQMSFVHVLTLWPTYDNEVEVIGVFTTRAKALAFVKFEDDWGGTLEIKRMKLDCVTALWR